MFPKYARENINVEQGRANTGTVESGTHGLLYPDPSCGSQDLVLTLEKMHQGLGPVTEHEGAGSWPEALQRPLTESRQRTAHTPSGGRGGERTEPAPGRASQEKASLTFLRASYTALNAGCLSSW